MDRLLAPVRGTGKTVRIATKSVRAIGLTERIRDRGGAAIRGVMGYSCREAGFLVERGFDDVLVAYPTMQPSDAKIVAESNARGATVRLVADDPRHLDVANDAARAVGARVPIVVDIDVGYRPLGARYPIGVRRSPLREASEIAAFAERVASRSNLRFAGLLAYEAHLAGVRDEGAGALMDIATRAMKRRAVHDVVARRQEILDELARRKIEAPLFNGGGTGSIETSAHDTTLTEVAVGSGFVDSHLFDGYRGLDLTPAAFFALQVTRVPSPGFITCHGGGFIASGAAGRDRLPIPVYPEGLELTPLEGAGEVQTPLRVRNSARLELGSPVFFRHAKAGELAEHFDSYLLVRGREIVGRARTYRGEGQSFV